VLEDFGHCGPIDIECYCLVTSCPRRALQDSDEAQIRKVLNVIEICPLEDNLV